LIKIKYKIIIKLKIDYYKTNEIELRKEIAKKQGRTITNPIKK